jgi:glycine/serine hydroxymethyltransferase
MEMRVISGLIERVIARPDDDAAADAVRGEVREMCGRFPLYGQWARE